MNKTLRSAVYKKRMTHNKFLKDKSNKNWEAYRKQRNLVTKLKMQSVRTYFYERCVGGPKSTDFYPTIKPFLTNKGSNITKDIILEDNNKIINDQLQVATNFAFDMPPNFCYFYLLKNYYVSSVFYKQHFSGFYS
jgi:hypothetical protein